jgi:hypothetical protein
MNGERSQRVVLRFPDFSTSSLRGIVEDGLGRQVQNVVEESNS